MPRAVWTGSIGFGLVSIPIRLYNATEQRDVRFRLFDRGSGRRIHYQRVAGRPDEASEQDRWATEPPPDAPATEEDEAAAPGVAEAVSPPQRVERHTPTVGPAAPPEVAYEDVVKGYEVSPDRYVMLTQDELRALEPERTRSIDIEEFVDLHEIDPLFFDRSYFVAPHRSAGSEKPYALLLEAMRRTERIAVGRFVLRSKSYLAAIRPVQDALVLHTLYYADEVRSAADIDALPVRANASDREVGMAVKLVEILSAAWDPTGHVDQYRERVLELIRTKAETGGLVQAEPEDATVQAASRLPELMEALRASVEAARQASKASPTASEPGRAKRARRSS
jgi:DNA end-binding protein Ku